jgi:flagellar hook-associated protein 1 FlgK
VDVTNQADSGQLGAALEQRNSVIPSLRGDFSQTGDLNQMAKSFADRVNEILGVPFFTYDQTNATNIAASLGVNPNITANQLPSSQVVSLTGSAVTDPFTVVPGTNDTLNFKLDGQAAPISITLDPTDASLTDVANDLNTQFAAAAPPIGMQATLNGNTGALQIQTLNTGANGSIQLLPGTANSLIGLTNPTPTYRNAANSVALSLAALANPTNAADQMNGQSFLEFFGSIAANIGGQLATAKDGQSTQQDLLTQAQSLRQQTSGVDLNEEATRVLELQTSYQAASRMMTVIDNITQSLLAIIPQ